MRCRQTDTVAAVLCVLLGGILLLVRGEDACVRETLGSQPLPPAVHFVSPTDHSVVDAASSGIVDVQLFVSGVTSDGCELVVYINGEIVKRQHASNGSVRPRAIPIKRDCPHP